MAAGPVKKLTNTRQRTRMAHKHVRVFNLSRCPQCQSVKLPHRACPNCGYYRGREVVSKEEPAT